MGLFYDTPDACDLWEIEVRDWARLTGMPWGAEGDRMAACAGLCDFRDKIEAAGHDFKDWRQMLPGSQMNLIEN